MRCSIYFALVQDDQEDDAGQQDDEGDEELAVGEDGFSGGSFRSCGHGAVAPGRDAWD